MKKYGIFLWLLLSVLPLCGGAQSLPARIKLDTDRSIGQIDTLIYSNFTEHLSSCIYGGLYDPGSRFSDKDGMRKDVIAAVKQLQVPLVRWPGGNFASGYHWQDGIGPKDKRPVRMDLAWHKRESNAFGTDEFMEWCRKVGTQPYLCVNLATGSLDEAHDWVEYCNIDKGTYFSDLRRSYGHEQPYHVKYWGLGNEVDGPWQIGHMSAVDYAKKALEAAKLMKWTDKS
ncbi:MAG: alpha-N-arabinofuranosidase, partial [Tannerella sp.]|nr:alpha-N-arabinofuranosidase [Tannerella sp.]